MRWSCPTLEHSINESLLIPVYSRNRGSFPPEWLVGLSENRWHEQVLLVYRLFWNHSRGAIMDKSWRVRILWKTMLTWNTDWGNSWSSTWKCLPGAMKCLTPEWHLDLQKTLSDMFSPVCCLPLLSFFLGNPRTLHPFNFMLFTFLKNEVLILDLPQGLLVYSKLWCQFSF